jgi:pimeloyl-ACP methyl ester carboxylesterase
LAERIYLPVRPDYERSFEDPQAARRAADMDWDPRRVPLATLAHAGKVDNVALSAAVPCPLLVVVCGRDRRVPREGPLSVHEAAPGPRKRIIELPRSGHSPFLEPEGRALAAECAAFLREHLGS